MERTSGTGEFSPFLNAFSEAAEGPYSLSLFFSLGAALTAPVSAARSRCLALNNELELSVSAAGARGILIEMARGAENLTFQGVDPLGSELQV